MTIPFGFCHCGCGQKTNLATRTDKRYPGTIQGQPYKYVRNHHTRIVVGTEYVINERGCWEWQYGVDSHGYGQRLINGRTQLVHRAMYIAQHGTLPRSAQLDHLCRNPKCVNPDHLEPVTNAENCRRGLRPKLNMKKAQLIRSEYAGGKTTQEALGKKFGVAQTIVSKIVLNQLWSSE